MGCIFSLRKLNQRMVSIKKVWKVVPRCSYISETWKKGYGLQSIDHLEGNIDEIF